MRARHEFVLLVLLALLCRVAWSMVPTLPAARTLGASRSRERHEARRPPRRLPAPPSHRSRGSVAALRHETAVPDELAIAAPLVAQEREAVAPLLLGEEIVVEGGASEWISFEAEVPWRWSPEGLAWARRFFYWRRAQEAHWRARREALRRRSHVILAPGSALATVGSDAVPSLCEVFRATCSGAHAQRTSTSTVAPDETATLRREGRSWQIGNGIVEATIDPDVLCTMSLRRWTEEASVPPFTFATPSPAPCEVVETAPPDPDVTHGAVALALTWRGDGWWQQVVFSLRDGAHSPEASVTRVQRDGSSTRSELGNLTASTLTWNLAGRELAVAPGRVVRTTLASPSS